ncbi:isoleucyl-tRNA synthase, putative [Babesia ovis]|uniref:Isoleucyl-tRNA synthase, putative n=1 Tax=Babesia ovis TaxID=5869 RepID=A0A9W5TCJ9_BABOV|nr:isoleucyl-tRNA synthase, putative [Babesia ovis]
MVAPSSLYTLIATIGTYTLTPVGSTIANLEVMHSGEPDNITEKPMNTANVEKESEINDIVNNVALKKELSESAEKLEQSVKTNAESRKTLDDITKEQDHIADEIGHVKLDRIKELNEKKSALLKKIAAIGKTLRVEHDARFPHLVGQPIIVVAKNEEDTMRTANTLAHIEGLRDTMNKIRSPCSSLEHIRSETLKTKRSSNHNRFAVVQKTLDSMSAEERLNYDLKMIEHYEGIIRELEDGIAEADEEIAASWQSYQK